MTASLLSGYLTEMVEQEGSDLYLTVGAPATIRGGTGIAPLADQPLAESDIEAILAKLADERQREEFARSNELNMALDLGERGRFRVSAFRQRQQPGLVIRQITTTIPSLDDLGLPELLGRICLAKSGLVLMVGATGSGKSTSLAAMIDYRNRNGPGHIITVEDPIEYVHEHKQCIITQREVGVDTDSYHIALKNALRQKPDVILVGEIRDLQVMEQALTISETGHLCLATLHANNTGQAVERVVNLFPEERQPQVRLALSLHLQAIVSQRLVPKVSGGRIVALEIMLNQGLVSDLIIKGDISKIKEVMAKNVKQGMLTFDQALFNLCKTEEISEETAIAQADVPTDLKLLIQQDRLGGEDAGLQSVDTSKLSF